MIQVKSKKVGNPKTPIKETQEMNDKDYLNAVLELEKNMSNNYSIALSEASNNILYNEFFDMFEDTKDMAREIYDVLFQKGWYQLEEENCTKINEKISAMEEELKQLP